MARNERPMVYECCCADITEEQWHEKMRGKRRISYKWMERKIRRECPEMVGMLTLDFYNPWHELTYSTRDYYVVTHSATEYFFRKL